MAAKLRIACHLIQWRGEQNENPEKVAREVADAGYDGIEGFQAKTADELVKLATITGKLGLHIVNAGAPTPDERFRFNLTLGNKATEIPACRRDQFGGKSPTDADFQRAAESIREVCALAKSYGLKPFHHAHLNTMIETPKDADKLLAYAPDLYLLFDTGHMLAANSNPLDALRAHGSRIAHVHLKDTRAKDPATWNRWTGKFGQDAWFEELGKGNLGLDIKAVLRGLEDIGYDGWVSVEQDRCTAHNPAETAKVNRDYLRSLGY
ncbi:MAG: TIM barrel protein [Planctomycetes bacterium]|nr:TIM barrel protein [Planctomycetota bacterium]